MQTYNQLQSMRSHLKELRGEHTKYIMLMRDEPEPDMRTMYSACVSSLAQEISIVEKQVKELVKRVAQ